jgi:aryl-alcohol dehydrogenase-like predicted oxidoreductase
MTSALNIASLPQIGLGCMGLGGRFEKDAQNDSDAINLIREAFDMGVRLFDTAEVYGAGHGEEVLGKAFSTDREKAFIASKFSASNAKYDSVIKACNASLKRLNTDYIDLYQCHWPNVEVPFEETLAALEELRKAGKIRFAGFSNVTTVQLREILEKTPSQLSVCSVQQDYSLIERFVERKVLPYCGDNALAMIAYSPLGQGKMVLKGNRLEVLNALAQKYNVSIYAIMLSFVTYKNFVFAIPMTSSLVHLRSNWEALGVALKQEEYDALSKAFAPNIQDIDVDCINVLVSHSGKVFKTRQEAQDNILNMSPSPKELAQELQGGEILKPVKVKPIKGCDGKFDLYEGQLRYWAWVIAHDGQKPIPALIEDKKL